MFLLYSYLHPMNTYEPHVWCLSKKSYTNIYKWPKDSVYIFTYSFIWLTELDTVVYEMSV